MLEWYFHYLKKNVLKTLLKHLIPFVLYEQDVSAGKWITTRYNNEPALQLHYNNGDCK